jgi:phosphatidylethanolamine-binding protein (PEBP) family uncharacterized protein
VTSTYQRLVATATGFCIALTGCGDKGLDKPLPKTSARLAVEGPWRNGAQIPRRYTCDGANIAPEVRASRPSGARDLALVMTDPDAPGGGFVHWTRWGSHREGTNSFGTTGYSGPCPPKGARPHHYVITFYALRRPLGLPAGSDPQKVVAAIQKNAFASGSLTGTYGR